MSTSDGAVGTATKVVDNGPGGRRWDLVVMGDGYRRGELTKFHDDVERFWAEVLKPTPPFDQLWPAINVHRVDVTSAQSGADMPCNGEGPFRTFFDASYCDPIWGPGASEWLLTVNEPLVKQVAGGAVPEWNVAMVLVNAEAYGGSGAPLVAVASTGSVKLIGLHELGHSAFGLADEYDSPVPIPTSGEPAQPNVTRNTDRATNKWRDLVKATTPMPTSCNDGCANCRPPTHAPPPDVVGTYEGALYERCGLYRPVPDCYMRANQVFCPVCARAIHRVLQAYLP
jgi:IgA peptidase M64